MGIKMSHFPQKANASQSGSLSLLKHVSKAQYQLLGLSILL